MIKKHSLVFLLFVCAATVSAFAQQRQMTQESVVKVYGSGETQEEAIRDGLRKAVESVFVKVYSQSQTQDFALVRDTILTRAAGLVKEYKVLTAQTAADGVVTLELKVTVSDGRLDDLWGQVTTLLRQMGRPKIMVCIVEKVDGKAQELSTLQTGLEQALLRNGFQLVDREQPKAIDKKDLEAAVAENSPTAVQSIAKRFGAQIFITGTASSDRAGKRMLYGRDFYEYQADSRVRVFRSDTAQLLASVVGSTPDASKGLQPSPNAAAAQALQRQAENVARKVTMDVLRFWTDVLTGRGEIKLSVTGIADYREYVKIKNALQGIEGVSQVNATFHNGNADVSLESSLSAEMLAEKMATAMNALKITDVSQNTIKAEYSLKENGND
ncbi:MAG TPA: hypothetical protein PKK48_04580 [Phycisphaerae bacterium]|nr:hypothetical protein [Phycisphaerae bacterium]